MPSKYKLGYYYERKVKLLLEKEGWDVWRSPASQTPIDIIAIKPENDSVRIKLIQVKRTSLNNNYEKIYKNEIEKLLEFAKKYEKYLNVDIELWIFKKNDKVPYIINIKNYLDITTKYS